MDDIIKAAQVGACAAFTTTQIGLDDTAGGVGANCCDISFNVPATSAIPNKEGQTDGTGAEDAASDDAALNQASQLVAFVMERAELFHDENGHTYAGDKATRETRRLDGRQFHDWLVSAYYGATEKSPRAQAAREALSTLTGIGRFKGECRDVHVRVAAHGGSYYLDLAEPGSGRAVKIDAGGWEIISRPPVRFLRPDSLRPLPVPIGGGDLGDLWGLVNVPKDARLLVLAWLGDCLRPDTPFPLLELIGEQGSAKSTTQAMLRRLIDPNACDLRAAPKCVDDLFVGAGANWIISLENVSYLPAAMQDALCIIATGGSHAKRRLYTDAEESVIKINRPVAINSIVPTVTAQDLVDRTVSVEIPAVAVRREMSDLRRDFEDQHGRLLGSLLDVIAEALAKLPNIHLAPNRRPRLIEFARFGMAVAEAMGQPAEDFMAQFTAGRKEAISRTIDSSPVGTAIIAWLESRDMRGAEMPVKSLWEAVGKYRATAEGWPQSPKGFADGMRRAAPALRQLGIECCKVAKIGSHYRWKIEAKEKMPTPSREGREVVHGQQDHDITTCTTSSSEVSTGAGESAQATVAP